MQAKDDFNFNRPQSNQGVKPDQGGRKWSNDTLRAVRPRPDDRYATRAGAEEWNSRFPPGDVMRVNPADFPEVMQSRSPEKIIANLKWLHDWGNGIFNPRPSD